ncbi:response regulator receiver modulated diguanylate cyclase [Pacificibacter maritimus]|uniref:diguanylate cyclase n=1 Tax=Pacificibacter maritimus TaxID=762213 RepID=A0A3N4UWT0_9RHOB|nr:diguanylate cyclase [Pacificibacter maritimus]RPE72021.1 response regulator receiver modulated diguanylate cyclase [Pacificibacter maritimus]
MAGRILIVDNVPTNRIILKVKLSSAFYEVIQAASGRDAMMRAKQDQPDIIILDTNLGDMTAHEACAQLKADPITCDIPVLIATPAADTEAKIAALKAGADEFLTKPIDELTLTARVRALLRARSTTHELRRRNETARTLGFAEAPVNFTMPGKIVLVGRNPEDAMTWRAGLRGLVQDTIEISQADRVIEKIAADDAADVYLISADIMGSTGGLSLISDIRARANTRFAGIVVVHGAQDRKEAIMALDLGANDIITRGADPEEMALRLRSQMRSKKEADALRSTIDEGLRLAMVDPLTGLYNRRYALPHIAQIAQASNQAGQNFALMLLDLDRFKRINDTYGHAVGDEVLKEVALRMQKCLRSVDLVARYGGEEFLICLPQISLRDARITAERIRAAICDTAVTVTAQGDPVMSSVSIGLAMGGAPDGTPVQHDTQALLDIADRALYDAKAEGRNQVTLGPFAA